MLGDEFAAPTTARKLKQIMAKDLQAKVSALKNMQHD